MSRPRQARTARWGFALLTVLWVLSGMMVLGVLLNRTTSEAIGTTGNRVDALRAGWANEGCLARAQASIDEALRDARDAEEIWGTMDRWTLADTRLHGCELEFVPAGVTLDVNAVSHDRLSLLFLAVGMRFEQADSLASAIDDWRDDDDEVQRDGAEQSWYRGLGRHGPRNAPFAAREELRLVRGLERSSEIDALIDVEQGRVLLTRAPAAVLATLPGFGDEAVSRVLELRAAGPINLLQFAASLSPAARAQLNSHFLELLAVATASPDAWIVTSRAQRPTTGGRASIEIRLLRSGRRAAIMRHRSNPWS